MSSNQPTTQPTSYPTSADRSVNQSSNPHHPGNDVEMSPVDDHPSVNRLTQPSTESSAQTNGHQTSDQSSTQSDILSTDKQASQSSNQSNAEPIIPLHLLDPSTGRLKGTVDKPFVYGTAAWWLGKQSVEGAHSHRWTVFLRGLENEDMSGLIDSVTFHLHASFANPTRVLTSAPYRVTETGWGEFSIMISVKFVDPSLPTVQLNHLLKLFPPPGTVPTTTKPVMSEQYDEFVFSEPTPALFSMLMRPNKGPVNFKDDLAGFYTTKEFARQEHALIVQLAAAREAVNERMRRERNRLYRVEQAIAEVSGDIAAGG